MIGRSGMRAVVSRIVAGAPVTIEAIVERAAVEMQMPLRVVPAVQRGSDLSGMAVRVQTTTRQIAVIFVPADARPGYQLHVAGHELWHLLRGHTCQRTEWTTGPSNWWELLCARKNEAACDRFAALLGVEVEQHQRYTPSAAALMVDEAFGVTAGGGR